MANNLTCQSKIYITVYCQAFVLSNHYSRACFDNFIPTFLASNTQNQTNFHAKIPRSFFGFLCKDMCYLSYNANVNIIISDLQQKICRGKIPEKIWLDFKHFIKQKIDLEFVSFSSGQSLCTSFILMADISFNFSPFALMQIWSGNQSFFWLRCFWQKFRSSNELWNFWFLIFWEKLTYCINFCKSN